VFFAVLLTNCFGYKRMTRKIQDLQELLENIDLQDPYYFSYDSEEIKAEIVEEGLRKNKLVWEIFEYFPPAASVFVINEKTRSVALDIKQVYEAFPVGETAIKYVWKIFYKDSNEALRYINLLVHDELAWEIFVYNPISSIMLLEEGIRAKAIELKNLCDANLHLGAAGTKQAWQIFQYKFRAAVKYVKTFDSRNNIYGTSEKLEEAICQINRANKKIGFSKS
jgi:hypothetical protein